MSLQISTKGRYALRSMLDIARQSVNGTVKIKEIAERQNISVKYLEQIVSELSRAGLLNSKRGPNGGYSLTRPPEDYTVNSILNVTEGNLSIVQCVSDKEYACERYDGCATVKLWSKINDTIAEVTDSIPLADLLEWDREGGGISNPPQENEELLRNTKE